MTGSLNSTQLNGTTLEMTGAARGRRSWPVTGRRDAERLKDKERCSVCSLFITARAHYSTSPPPDRRRSPQSQLSRLLERDISISQMSLLTTVFFWCNGGHTRTLASVACLKATCSCTRTSRARHPNTPGGWWCALGPVTRHQQHSSTHLTVSLLHAGQPGLLHSTPREPC